MQLKEVWGQGVEGYNPPPKKNQKQNRKTQKMNEKKYQRNNLRLFPKTESLFRLERTHLAPAEWAKTYLKVCDFKIIEYKGKEKVL